MPAARTILPFVRLSYGSNSSYTWVDDEGRQRTVTQAEGGEQGDPLMPLLFSIGIQGALEEVATSLVPGEHLCAYLDDVYLLCTPERVVPLYKLLSEVLAGEAGITLHQGKTKVWNQAGRAPEDVHELGPEVWRPQGLKILGTPIGTPEFVSQKMNERIEDERQLWETIPSVPDLQCAWQLLVQSEPKGQPQLAHHATKLHHRICESSRPRLMANSGSFPPSDARHGSGKGICQRFGNFADEDGRFGAQVCNQMRRVSVLGIVG